MRNLFQRKEEEEGVMISTRRKRKGRGRFDTCKDAERGLDGQRSLPLPGGLRCTDELDNYCFAVC